MDVNTLMKIVLSANSTGALSKMTGASIEQVSNVLTQVMPILLDGASAQAKGASTAAGFAQAILDHGQKDTRDVAKFFGGVDLGDGAKIVQHLLGGNTAATALTVAKAVGLKQADVLKVMVIVAPLILSILGQQKKKHPNDTSALIQAMMAGTIGKGIDAGTVLGLLGKLMK